MLHRLLKSDWIPSAKVAEQVALTHDAGEGAVGRQDGDAADAR